MIIAITGSTHPSTVQPRLQPQLQTKVLYIVTSPPRGAARGPRGPGSLSEREKTTKRSKEVIDDWPVIQHITAGVIQDECAYCRWSPYA